MEKVPKIRTTFNNIISYHSFVGAIWIVLIMILIIIDVVGRSLFNQPILGTAEIVRNSIVGITFLQLAHVLKDGRHIRTTVIFDRIPNKGKVILNMFSSLLGLLLFILIVYQSWGPAWESLINKEYEGEGALEVPTFPARFLIVLGSALMALQFLMNLYDAIKSTVIPKANKNITDR